MESKWIRLWSFIGALGLALGMFVPAQADTTGTVTVTGQIVASPLSMTIDQSSVAFGNIDSAGPAQGGTVLATGWTSTGGAVWVAKNPVTISVSSPGVWQTKACHGPAGTMPPGGLSTSLGLEPATMQNAVYAYENRRLTSDCATLLVGATGNTGQSTTTVYLLTKVSNSDPSGSFNTTVTFSVALS